MPSRRNRRNNRKSGGAYSELSGAPTGWSDSRSSSALNLAQGEDFAKYHSGQHGGASSFSSGSPVSAVTAGSFGTDGVPMPSAMQTGLQNSYKYIAGMTDQVGGKKNRKNKRNSRKNRSSRSSKKNTRKQYGGLYRVGGGRRRYSGGSSQDMSNPMPVQDSGKMLISRDMVAQAGLNPEWRLAENPNSFAPL